MSIFLLGAMHLRLSDRTERSGGRHRVRTSDPCLVNAVLYRQANCPEEDAEVGVGSGRSLGVRTEQVTLSNSVLQRLIM